MEASGEKEKGRTQEILINNKSECFGLMFVRCSPLAYV